MSPLTLSLSKGALTPYAACLQQAGHSPATLFSVILVLDTGIQGIPSPTYKNLSGRTGPRRLPF